MANIFRTQPGDLQITFGNGEWHINEKVGRRWVYRFSNHHADHLGDVLDNFGWKRQGQLPTDAEYRDLLTGYYRGRQF